MLSALLTKLFIIAQSIEIVQLKEKQLYELEADDFVIPIIGDIYKARTNLDRATTPEINNINIYNTSKLNARKQFSEILDIPKFDKAEEVNDTDVPDMNITKPKRRYLNITMAKAKLRRMTMYLDKMLNDNTSLVPNFADGEDDPNTQTRRFDSIRKGADERFKKFNASRRAATQFLVYTRDTNIEKKMKIFSLMQQFVYHIRYWLPISQLLRKKYMDNYSYKIGFCMCTFRILFFHARRLSSTLKTYNKEYPNIYIHMKIYERMVRLYVDMKDLVNLMKKLEYEKKLSRDPKFYDVSLETEEDDK